MPIPGILEMVKEFDPEIIITHFAPVTGEVIEKAKSLEVIGCLRGGVENINVEAAARGISLFFNNSGRTANAVAEFALAHMLVVSRNPASATMHCKTGSGGNRKRILRRYTAQQSD